MGAEREYASGERNLSLVRPSDLSCCVNPMLPQPLRCLSVMLSSCFLFSVAAALVAAPAAADDWPSLRGPRFDGSAAVGDKSLASGPLQLKVVWKQPVGSGYSGVVKAGDVLVSAMAEVAADREYLFAMAAESGEILWKTPTGKVMKGENGSFDGPVGTPAVDTQRAYHLSPFGDLIACSLTDGRKVWSHNFTQEYGVAPNFYGFGASPIVHHGVLIVAVGAKNGAYMGFDPVTGQLLWQAGSDGASFQSPVPAEVGGRRAVIAAGNTMLYAIEVKTGEILWSQPHGGSQGMPAWAVIPVPLPGGGYFLADSRESSTAVNVTSSGAEKRWSGREIRNSYCVPVMSGGLLCSYSSRFLVAVDPTTGKRVFRSRRPGNGFVATLADRLVVATLDGSLHIGDVSSAGFQEVASQQVFDSSAGSPDGLMWALPSVAGRSVYLRSLGAIARVDVASGNAAQTLAAEESVIGPRLAACLQQAKAATDPQAVVDRFLAKLQTPLIEGDVVQFLLQGDYEDVAVASELMGIRQERPMQRVPGTDLFYYGLNVPGATRASYTFFADYQPVVDPRNRRQVVSTTLVGEMEPNFMGPGKPLVFSWFDKGGLANGLPKVTDVAQARIAGRVEDFVLESQAMKEKIPVRVYLPPGYDDSQAAYPVVFVHEGRVAIDSGNQLAIVDSLISARQIRPAVVVFVQRKFYPMMGANGYPEMFAGELLPRVSQAYRLSDDRADRACLSGGFGATLALIGTLPSSDLIGRVGCHSPFAFEMLHPMIRQLAAIPKDRCDVLIQWGTYEFRNPSENWDMTSQAQAIAGMLQEGGHRVTTEATAVGSDWVCWRTQSARMWEFLLGSGE